MLLSNEENQVAVYMIRNPKTGAAYIGSSQFVSSRLTWHRRNLKYRASNDAGAKRLRDGLGHIDGVEFRILEFVVLPQRELINEDDEFDLKDEQRSFLLDREYHWIRTLNPSLNRRIPVENTPLHSLPCGSPASVVGKAVDALLDQERQPNRVSEESGQAGQNAEQTAA